jgi:chromosome segregation ATPase
MDWMSLQWITAYWMPLLIAVGIGLILGWLLIGLPAQRRNAELEERIAEHQSKNRRTERELMDARREIENLNREVSRVAAERDEVRSQWSAAQEALKASAERIEGLQADLQARSIEVADVKMQLAMLHDQLDRTQSSAANELEELRTRYEAAVLENKQLREALDSLQSKLSALEAEAGVSAENERAREAALNEAYQRAVNLQSLLEESERARAELQAELDSLKATVAALSATKADLEDRLQKARGDVASEMAALTSTMIKMKDEELLAANTRIAELTRQLHELQAKQAVG